MSMIFFTLEFKIVLFVIILNLWLMAAGAYNDGFKPRHRHWLKSHKSAWRLRDWIIGFNHIFWLSEFIFVAGWWTVGIYAFLLFMYAVIFSVWYDLGKTDAKLIQPSPKPFPAWKWRRWQILPGLLVGLAGYLIRTFL